MKKLLILILTVAASTARCDQLLDAINEHNLERVTLLLKHKQYDPSSHILYVNAAHEAVDRCRDDVLVQKLKPEIDPSLAAAGCAFMMASCYPAYQIYNKHMDFELGSRDIGYITC